MITEIVNLLESFATIDGLTANLPVGTYHTTSMNAMSVAQTELIRAGYDLDKVVMDEGFYYRLSFVPPFIVWPETINLIYIASGTLVPSLALMYRDEDGKLTQFSRAGRVASNTSFDLARSMLATFKEDRKLSRFEPFWLPVFPGSPLALEY